MRAGLGRADRRGKALKVGSKGKARTSAWRWEAMWLTCAALARALAWVKYVLVDVHTDDAVGRRPGGPAECVYARSAAEIEHLVAGCRAHQRIGALLDAGSARFRYCR